MWERDEVVARLLCTKVETFTLDLPLADGAIKFMSLKEHGCKWTESLMAKMVPGDLRRLFAMARAASSPGPAKAKLLLERTILLGQDGYARRNHGVTRMMQLPPGDGRRATYSFLRDNMPFCPPTGRFRQMMRELKCSLQLSTVGGRICMSALNQLLLVCKSFGME